MPPAPHLRERINRGLDALSDEKAYQVLDFVEFMSSKYAERQAPSPNIFTKFTEGVEDTMRAGRVSTVAISETMGLLSRAMGVLNGVAAAGKSVATDIASVATTAAKTVTGESQNPPPNRDDAAPPAGSAPPV